MSKKFLNILVIALGISLAFQLFIQEPTPTPEQAAGTSTPVSFETTKSTYSQGKVVELKVRNNTDQTIRFNTACPEEPFTVFYTSLEKNEQKTATADIDCNTSLDPAAKDLVINAGSTGRVRYLYWSNSLFDKLGTYQIAANFTLGEESFQTRSNEFTIKERGFLGKIWINIFYQPIYNFLLLLISVIPGKNLGLAIILLTFVLRGLLFVPSHKAMKQQKKVAEIQPKLNKIRKKYKDNQQKMAEETMKIWKENKVNPMGSCLPLLIQFPILIALFYVIQDGLNPDKIFLLYSYLEGFEFHDIQTVFLNILPLTKKNAFILPIIIGGLQFIQLKLSMANNQKPKKGEKASDTEMMQNMMIYMMPAMIAVFTASLPAGVGLYWGTSTLFGIGQQLIVNKSKDKK
jgi:YidC/Oxa1 family membrane protein insertase